MRALVRTPRLLRPVQQVLKDDAVYVYHTKINTKPAIEGTVWQWHQDYGSWMRDGCRRPDMATFNVMMTDTTEMGGALYLIPGSHRLGRIEPVWDESTSYKFWAMPKQRMIEILKTSPEPVAVTGRAGTCVLFHCNLLHASTISRPTTAGTSTSRATPSPTSRSSGPTRAPTGWCRGTGIRYRSRTTRAC